LSLGAKERRFGTDSGKKFEDLVQKYLAWSRQTAAWPRRQSLKLNGQS